MKSLHCKHKIENEVNSSAVGHEAFNTFGIGCKKSNKAYLAGKLWIITLDYHRHTRKSTEKHGGFWHNNQQGGILIGGKSVATFKRAKKEVQQFVTQIKLNPSHGDHRKKYLLNDEELTKAGYKGYEVEAKNLGVSLSKLEERIQKVYETNTVWKTKSENKTQYEQRGTNHEVSMKSHEVNVLRSTAEPLNQRTQSNIAKNEPNNKPLLKSYIKSYKICQAQKIKKLKKQTNDKKQMQTTVCKHWQSALTKENIEFVKQILDELPQIKGKYDFKDNIMTIDNRETKYLQALIKLVYKCHKDVRTITKFCNEVRNTLIRKAKWLNVQQVRKILSVMLSFSFIDTTLAKINKEQLEEFRTCYTTIKQSTSLVSDTKQKEQPKVTHNKNNLEVINKVIKAVGKDHYNAWFKNRESVILCLENGKCVCKLTQSGFVTDIIKTHYYYDLIDAGIDVMETFHGNPLCDSEANDCRNNESIDKVKRKEYMKEDAERTLNRNEVFNLMDLIKEKIEKWQKNGDINLKHI